MSECIKVPYAYTIHGQEKIDAIIRGLKSSTQMEKIWENLSLALCRTTRQI